MIFDRTQNDIDAAIRLRTEKVKTFKALTEEEVQTLERGFLTINTLNRIESKQSEIKNVLNGMNYFASEIKNQEWTMFDFFGQSDFDRISQNNELLKKAFFVYKDTPKKQDKNFTKFETINTIEKVLFDLEKMVDDVKSRYRICGAYECGGDE